MRKRSRLTFDYVAEVIQKICVYGLVSCLALLLFSLTYNCKAYGASAIVVVLYGFGLFIISLNYRRVSRKKKEGEKL